MMYTFKSLKSLNIFKLYEGKTRFGDFDKTLKNKVWFIFCPFICLLVSYDSMCFLRFFHCTDIVKIYNALMNQSVLMWEKCFISLDYIIVIDGLYNVCNHYVSLRLYCNKKEIKNLISNIFDASSKSNLNSKCLNYIRHCNAWLCPNVHSCEITGSLIYNIYFT